MTSRLLPLAFGLALLLFALLRPPAALLLDVGTAGDDAFLLNFHQPEQNAATDFRWSGPASRLRLPGAHDLPHALALRLNGDALHALEAPTLQLAHADQTIAALDVAPGWRVYHVLLPAGVAASNEPLALVSALARPGPTDSRYLGLPLDWLRLEPLGAASPLDLVLLLAAVGYGVWVIIGQGLWVMGNRSGALTHHPSPITHHPSPITSHPSPLTSHPSPLTHHLSPITSHPSPLTSYLSSSASPTCCSCCRCRQSGAAWARCCCCCCRGRCSRCCSSATKPTRCCSPFWRCAAG